VATTVFDKHVWNFCIVQGRERKTVLEFPQFLFVRLASALITATKVDFVIKKQIFGGSIGFSVSNAPRITVCTSEIIPTTWHASTSADKSLALPGRKKATATKL
jgi:hypothetical protein